MTDAPAVRMEAVSKRFSRRGPAALDGISLHVRAGEILGLLGHNGAGKTTLLKLALGLARPTAGEIQVLGEDPSASTTLSWRRYLGYLPENVSFQGNLTGLATLEFYGRLKQIDPNHCQETLRRVHLAEEAWRRPVRTYSKGMRQRLGLAQALMGAPRLLLLDEPTTGLDPTQRLAVFDMLQILKQQGTTIIISTHQLAELERHCDRVAILSNGRLQACDTPKTLGQQAGLLVTIRVETQQPTETLTQLAHLDGAPADDGHTVVFTCQPGQTNDCVTAIHASGVALTDMHIQRPGLEAVYFHYCRPE